MKKLLALVAALFLATGAAAAPGLWVIRDADTEITLFGTIHALPAGEKWLDARISERLDAADTLVLEAVLPDDPMALAQYIHALGMPPGQKPLARRLPPAVAARLPAAAAAAGVPLAALDGMATWLAAITLSEATLARAGISAADGVEPALLKRARTAGKPVIGLETAEQQLRYLANLPEPDQVALLVATLGDGADARAEADALLAAWRLGDVDAIARDFETEARASPLLSRVLLTDRNQRWADWIASVMRRPGRVFIAVGAGHFGGPDGLLALLAARGLTAAPIP